jgi:hypothetical protein
MYLRWYKIISNKCHWMLLWPYIQKFVKIVNRVHRIVNRVHKIVNRVHNCEPNRPTSERRRSFRIKIGLILNIWLRFKLTCCLEKVRRKWSSGKFQSQARTSLFSAPSLAWQFGYQLQKGSSAHRKSAIRRAPSGRWIFNQHVTTFNTKADSFYD